MQVPSRQFHSIFSDDRQATRDWYVALFGYETTFESDWFVHLRVPGRELLELGILRRTHEIVPVPFRGPAMGGMLTIVVDEVDRIHEAARLARLTVIEAPRDLFYGQRRLLLQDPNGVLVDVSSECQPDPGWFAGMTNARE